MIKLGRSSKNGKDKTVEVDLLSLVSVILIVLMGVFTLLGIIGFFSQFLKVTRFEVKGESPYEVSELLAGAELKKGDRLYKIDLAQTEEKLLKNCAYLESVKIKRSFPNKIKFIVESYDPLWYVEISGDFYVLDEELRVLEETKDEQRLKDGAIVKLTLPKIKTVIVGETLTYGDSDEEIAATEEIMNTVLDSEVRPILTAVDIDNRYDIHLELDRRFTVNAGSYSKLDVKLKKTAQGLAEEDLEKVTGGTVDIAESGSKISFRLTYASTENEKEESDAVG